MHRWRICALPDGLVPGVHIASRAGRTTCDAQTNGKSRFATLFSRRFGALLRAVP